MSSALGVSTVCLQTLVDLVEEEVARVLALTVEFEMLELGGEIAVDGEIHGLVFAGCVDAV